MSHVKGRGRYPLGKSPYWTYQLEGLDPKRFKVKGFWKRYYRKRRRRDEKGGDTRFPKERRVSMFRFGPAIGKMVEKLSEEDAREAALLRAEMHRFWGRIAHKYGLDDDVEHHITESGKIMRQEGSK